MKRLLFIIAMLWGVAHGQSTGYLRYDSVRMEKVGGNSEFILLNGTRNVTGGVLTNLGNGRTAFATPSAGLDYNIYNKDSTISDATDSVRQVTLLNRSKLFFKTSGYPVLESFNIPNYNFGIKDTVTSNSYYSTPRHGFYFERQSDFNSGVTRQYYHGSEFALHIRTPDSMRFNPTGGDAVTGTTHQLIFQKQSGVSRSVIVTGGGVASDPTSTTLSNILLAGSSIRTRGSLAGHTSYLNVPSNDTVGFYMGNFVRAVSNGKKQRIIDYWAGLWAASNADSVYSFVNPGANARFVQGGDMLVGLRAGYPIPGQTNDAELNPIIGQFNDASAILQVESTTKGFLPPRMTQGQRDAISSPATGLLIYQTDATDGFYYYDGSAWTAIGGGSGANLYNTNGTLTGNRTLSGDAGLYDLEFRDLAQFRVYSAASSPIFQVSPSGIGVFMGDFSASANGTFLSVEDDIQAINLSNFNTSGTFFKIAGYGSASNGDVLSLTSNATGEVGWITPSGGSPAWELTGNAGTAAGTNYMGSSDNVAIDFRTNATQAMRLNTSQELMIGSTTDNGSYLLQVNGNILTMGGFLSMGTAGSSPKLTPSGSSILAVRVDNSDYATFGAKYLNATTGVYSGHISTVPTAWFHAAAGTTTVAPFKFTSGTNLTTPAAGALEWNGTQLFLTSSTPTRHILAQVSGSTALTSGTTPVATTDGRLTDGLILASGTYTPTLTNNNNLDASTAFQCQYMRVGNTVTVSGRVDVDPTSAGTQVQLNITLPIASDIGALNDVAGVGFAADIAGQGAAIIGSASGNSAVLEFIAGDLTNQEMWFTFTYLIL